MDPDDTSTHSWFWWTFVLPRIRYLTLVAALQVADSHVEAGPSPEPWRESIITLLEGVVAYQTADTMADQTTAQQVRATGMAFLKRGLSVLEKEEAGYK